MRIYTIPCPSCGKIRTLEKSAFYRARKYNKDCISCVQIGEKNPNFGKRGKDHFNFGRIASEETRKKMSDVRRGEKAYWFGKCGPGFGKPRSEETKRKISLSNSGKNHYLFGKNLSTETKLKISASSKIYSKESCYNSIKQRRHFHQWLRGASNNFENYIGLSLNEFKIWIACKFKENMTWDNYGKYTWHIDHRHPLSRFDLTQEIKVNEAWNFLNLQPLSAKDNLKKFNHLSQS